MTVTVRPAAIPADSEICHRLPGAHFHDCYQRREPAATASSSAMQFALQTFLQMPPWAALLMRLRNRVVTLFGLKNLGAFNNIDRLKPAAAYRVGDRVGIFSVRYLSEQEVILGDADRHLDVQVSIHQCHGERDNVVSVTTVVHVHNTLGRLYMFFVAPLHRLIAPASLRRR